MRKSHNKFGRSRTREEKWSTGEGHEKIDEEGGGGEKRFRRRGGTGSGRLL
jgi:hypothetical protein